MDKIELLVSEQLAACTFASVSLRVTARAAQTFASVAHDILMTGEEVFRAIDIEMRTRLIEMRTRVLPSIANYLICRNRWNTRPWSTALFGSSSNAPR